jgi:Xaa-Pro dipeptidase
MTFHVIAGMWMTGYGFETSASIRVTDSGHELFCDVPRGLIVKNGGAA